MRRRPRAGERVDEGWKRSKTRSRRNARLFPFPCSPEPAKFLFRISYRLVSLDTDLIKRMHAGLAFLPNCFGFRVGTTYEKCYGYVLLPTGLRGFHDSRVGS